MQCHLNRLFEASAPWYQEAPLAGHREKGDVGDAIDRKDPHEEKVVAQYPGSRARECPAPSRQRQGKAALA